MYKILKKIFNNCSTKSKEKDFLYPIEDMINFDKLPTIREDKVYI